MTKGRVGDQLNKTALALGEYLKEQRLHARLSLRQLAEQAGVSNPYLSQIERGLRKPSAEVLQQIAKAMRISAEQLYVQAGILHPADGVGGSVELAVLGDTRLTERQKRSLLEIYSSFLALNSADEPAATSYSREGEGRVAEPEGPIAPAAAADAEQPATSEVSQKPVVKRAAVKRVSAKTAKKAPIKKAPIKKASVKKAAARKTAAKKATAPTVPPATAPPEPVPSAEEPRL